MKWRNSASDNIIPGISEERLLRAARDYVEAAYPNPERVGCPGRNRLEALARHKSPLADEMKEIEHVVNCSPCFVEYHAIRRARRRKRALVVGTLLGCVLLIVAFSGIFLLSRNRVPVSPRANRPVDVAQQETRKIIDLRPFETVRGESPADRRRRPAPVPLERANLLLGIQLPIGSEEGTYRLQLIDSKGAARIQTSGAGTIKDYVTTVEARFDLSSLFPGRYTLTVQRQGALAVTSYPVEVR